MFKNVVATLLATCIAQGAAYAANWERLGERHVGFISDHDTIEVGRREGKFKRLKLRVSGNDIELNSVKVIFGNGQVEDVTQHPR